MDIWETDEGINHRVEEIAKHRAVESRAARVSLPGVGRGRPAPLDDPRTVWPRFDPYRSQRRTLCTMNDVLKDEGRFDSLALEAVIEHDYLVNPQLNKLPCDVFETDDDTLTQDSLSPGNDFMTSGNHVDSVEVTRDEMDAFESAAAAVEFDALGFDWEEDSALNLDFNDFAWEPTDALPDEGRVNKKRKLESAQSLSQRSLGPKYTANSKPVRLLLTGEQDPLARLANWRGVCADLIAVGYLRQSYATEGQCSTRFDMGKTVPLAWMNSISKKDKWAIYHRLYKKLPFEWLAKLSVFRWAASVIREYLEATFGSEMVPEEILLNANNFLQTELASCASEAGASTNMKRAVFRSEEYKTSAIKGAFIVKGRFVVTGYGRTVLQLPSWSFQPKVPACLVKCIRRSLTTDGLHIARGKDAINQKSIVYAHEQASPSADAEASMDGEDIDCLGRRCAPGMLCDFQCGKDTDPALTQTRKVLLIHLAAWDEGGAAFAMKQVWGKGDAYDIVRNKICSLGARFWKQQQGQMSSHLLPKVRERMDALKSAPMTLSVATDAVNRDQPDGMPQPTLPDAVREAEPATNVQTDGDSRRHGCLEDTGIPDPFEETRITPPTTLDRLPAAQTRNLENLPTVALFEVPDQFKNGLSVCARPGKFHHDFCFCLSGKNQLSTIFMSFFPCAWPRMLTSISWKSGAFPFQGCFSTKRSTFWFYSILVSLRVMVFLIVVGLHFFSARHAQTRKHEPRRKKLFPWPHILKVSELCFLATELFYIITVYRLRARFQRIHNVLSSSLHDLVLSTFCTSCVVSQLYSETETMTTLGRGQYEMV